MSKLQDELLKLVTQIELLVPRLRGSIKVQMGYSEPLTVIRDIREILDELEAQMKEDEARE